MRQLYFILIIMLVGAVSAIAQPTVAIGDQSACTNESFCVPFTIDDFTNITGLEFTITYDPNVLRWDNATNFNADLVANGGLGIGNFIEDTPGEIRFTGWNTGDCNSTSNLGTTLDDGLRIFDLCFTAIGTYGDRTTIQIANSPTPQCFRNSTRCFNIGLLTESSTITLCVREFITRADNVSGNEGDEVCMEFLVEGFDGLSGIQYTINYDPSFLRFESLQPNFDIPQNSLAAYGLPTMIAAGPGNITVSWSFNVPGEENGVTVPDGTRMYTVCFTILGECENSTVVTFGTEPTPQGVSNTDPANPGDELQVPFRFEDGRVTVNDCNPEGIQMSIDCGNGPANVGDIITVQVLAGSNFSGVRELEYLMTWNDAILEFIGATDPENRLVGLQDYPNADNWDGSNINNGVLGFMWDSPIPIGQTLNNGEVMYEIQFRVVGLGGNAPIQIVTPGRGVITSGNTNIGIAPTNCTVEVNQPESVGLSFENLSVPLNETGCLPVSVSNFNAVTSLAFTADWDDNLWQFTQITNINPLLTGAGPANFTPFGTSSIIFDWDNTDPISLPDETVIFEMCFQTTATALPGDCGDLILLGLPVGEEAITANSNGENIGIIETPAEMCILFPEGFGLAAGTVSVGWRDTICVPFTVESFDNITAANFNVVWDPQELQFVSATPVNWSGLTLNAPNPVGTLNGVFNSATPVAIPDGEIAFEVCFQAIADPESCYDVEISNTPLPTVQTTNGDGSIVITNGEVCVEEQIVIESINITPTSCPNSCDGAVEITVFEWAGQGFIGTVWETEPIRQNTPLMVDEVCIGELIFTIFDNRTGATLTDTIMIPTNGSTPTVEIRGPEVVELPCNGGLAPLNVDDPVSELTYNWYFNALSGAPEFTGRQSVLVANPGNYIVQGLNSNGCFGLDTVMVVLSEGVVADAGEAPAIGITCTQDSIILNGSGSGAENLTFMWEPIPAGRPIDTMTMNTPNLVVTTPGQYRLNVTDPATNCTSSDIVLISDDRVFPNACADPESIDGNASMEQDCNGADAVFDASCSTNDGLTVSYTWLDPEGNEAGTGLTFGANALGTYELVVVETTTGCTDTAFASIIPNSSAPMVTIDPASAIDCNQDTLMLNASITPEGLPNLTIEWTPLTGGQLRAGTENTLTPTALSPGDYQLLVTNTDNNCQGDAIVTIADSTAAPIATISNDPATSIITCSNTSVLLDGSDSDDGDHLTYQWLIQADPDLMAPNGNTDSLRVSDTNNYILEVANTNTGCTSRDTIVVGENLESLRIVPNSVDPFVLTCDVDTALLSVIVERQVGNDFVPAVLNEDYRIVGWTPSTGIIDYSTDSLSVTVNEIGIYNVQVINLNSGCEAATDFQVEVNRQDPVIGVSSDTLVINCATTEATLSGVGSSDGNDFIYRWEDSQGNIVSDMLQTTVSVPDNYRLFVTNTVNNCSVDSLVVVVADTISPIATIAPVSDITCADLSRSVTVEVTNVPNISVTWPDPLPNGQTIEITQTGTFEATVTNTDNGCQSTVSVTIDGDVVPPPISLATLPAFDCDTESAEIDASDSGAESDFSSITWTSADGSPITEMMGNRLIASVVDTGTYQLTLVSAINGCSSDTIFTIGVVENPSTPTIRLATLPIFDCDTQSAEIDASASGAESEFAAINWTSADGNPITPMMGNMLIASVVDTGTYQLSLVSAFNGCSSDTTITIDFVENPTLPVIDLGTLPAFDCDTDSVDINATASGLGSDFSTIDWTSADGSPITPMMGNPLIASVVDTGTYQLSLVTANNSCSVDTSFTIGIVENPTIPMVQINGPLENIGCDGDEVVIDITPTGTTDDFTSISWTSLNSGNNVDETGPNPLIVSVDGAGDYVIELTYAGVAACVSQDTITVQPDPETPVADAGPDQTIDCGDSGTLDGSNSSTGPNFTYEWVPQEDSPALTDVTSLTPAITDAGSYVLVVTNNENSCIDTSGVVTVNLILPDSANAGIDQIICGDATELNALAVIGTQGTWTTTGGAIIDFTTDPATAVSALNQGSNTFTWTLTAPDCPQYISTDDVIITRTTTPVAENDQLEIEQGSGSGSINILSNDNDNGASSLTVRIIDGPEGGVFDSTAIQNGNFIFTPDLTYTGITSATYEICSVDCPELCATATIQITVRPPGEDFPIPNTITPNDDGANDVFIFDQIRFANAEDIPDNELIIFNRWGDIIYEAQPYNNDWNGTNEQGEPIPEGTYYYILRLDISEGEILRGDITVIR